MIKHKLTLALPLSMLALFGCSGSEDLYAPVEAPEIVNSFEPQEIFDVSSGGVDKYFSIISPAFVGNTLYVSSRNGYVKAMDASDGSTLWSIDLDDEDENSDKRSARLSAALDANQNYVAVGSENGYIYVLDAKDGHVVWKKYLEGEIVSKPAFSGSGDALFVQDTRGRIFCLQSSDGSERWVAAKAMTSLRLRSQSSFIVVGDEYVISGQPGGKVGVYLQSTGALVNEVNISRAAGINDLERIADVSSTPLLLGDDLYATSYNGSLSVFSFNDNTMASTLGYSSSQNMDFDDNYIVITDDKGHVYCIDRQTGAEVWVNSRLTYRKTGAPAIYGNYVVVGDYEGYLYFMSLADGKIESMLACDNSAIYSSPVVHDGRLYVFANDGSIICLSHDPAGLAKAKEGTRKVELMYAGANASLMAPGVGESGVYAPDVMDEAALMARRAAIIKAVEDAQRRQRAAALAQKKAYEKARAEYEAKVKAYEEERRKRLSGFGLMPQEGVKSDAAEDVQPGSDNTQVQQAPAPQVDQVEESKASGFGL